MRLTERFKTFSPAYRFFDTNFNNRVSLNEFIIGMENLKVKLSSRDQQMIFNYLDKDNKGYIDYNDFCGLCEERRYQNDPANEMLKEYQEKGSFSYNFGKRQVKKPGEGTPSKSTLEHSVGGVEGSVASGAS